MDVRQLRCLIAVAETASFTAAAERLRLAQSALSRRVQLLEEEFGVRLIERDKRAPVRPTDAGRIFIAAARAALDQFELTREVGRRLGRGDLGRIRIGFVASATFSGVMAAMVTRFRRDRTDVSIDLIEMDSDRQLAAIAAGDLDVGFLRPRTAYPDSVDTALMLREPVALAVHRESPLATGEAPIAAADLGDAVFILPRPDDEVSFSGIVQRLEARGGFSARIDHRMPDFIAVLSMVGSGVGVAPVPDSLRCVAAANIVYRRLTDEPLMIDLLAAFRRHESSPAIADFVNALREVAVRNAATETASAATALGSPVGIPLRPHNARASSVSLQ